MSEDKKSVVVAMSGGVDSSVTAALLLEQGYDVVGLTMQLWEPEDYGTAATCGSGDSADDARKVAEQLGIPFHLVDFRAEFRHGVIDCFCDEYFSGRTPNPCVLCNQFLKFDLLLRHVRNLKADFMATGHYASIVADGGVYQLRKGLDHDKDQSYFLFTLSQEQLSVSLFPLGRMCKEEVRRHAERFNLQVAHKKESQDICFIPDGDYVRFLEQERGCGQLSGDIVHVSGQVLGQHEGVYRYTVGQRKGLGIGWTAPLFVVGIDVAKRQVIVGERDYLDRSELTLCNCNWSPVLKKDEFRADCRIRYRQREVPAAVQQLANGRARVLFDQPQKGITPGQAAVCYADDQVLGGGWIE